MHTARLFTNGRNQAVRIPKKLAFKGVNEVIIRKQGDKLIIEPLRKSWTSLANEAAAGADFMADRPDITAPGRVHF